MDESHFRIQVDQDSVASRARGSQRGRGVWLIVVGSVLVLLIGAGFFFWPRQPITAPNAALQQPVPADDQVIEVVTPQSPLRVVDDGQALWRSPTEGDRIDCSHLLAGTQLILQLRVADLLAHAEGEKVLAALGPWGARAVTHLTNATGGKLSEIETLLLGIRPARRGSLDFAWRLHLRQPISPERLGQNCFLTQQGAGRVLVGATANAFAELKAQAGEPPLFARELQRVLQQTDAARTVTLVFAGKFLQISGEKFLRGAGAPLREALVDFLGDEATATVLSAHWDENFFLELRSTVALHERPHRFAALLEQRVAESADKIEEVVLTEPLHPYGRKVLARFPAMLRKLGNYTRGGEDRGLSVLRSYLPVTAGHNLLMATELLLGRTQKGSIATTAMLPRTGLSSLRSQTIHQRLQTTTSLVFPKETLQRALEMLSEAIDVPLEIAGRDLQLEGITKNQSFALELRDRPAAEILQSVLLRANPDRTASGPTDVKQKLVYVVRESQGERPGAIVVTTRTAANRRGEQLPDVFKAAPR